MDRVELRTKFSGHIEKFDLDGYEFPVYLRELSALDRAKVLDKFRTQTKNSETDENFLQNMTIESQCYIVCKGLVDESGKRTYQDDETQSIAEEIPGKALDAISQKILELSGLTAPQVKESSGPDESKNSVPVLSESSSSVLQ